MYMVSIYRSLLHERFTGDITFRSSCPEMLYQNDPNKNFRKEKIFLNKIEDYRLTAISEKRLWHRSFPAKFPRISFLRKTSG